MSTSMSNMSTQTFRLFLLSTRTPDRFETGFRDVICHSSHFTTLVIMLVLILLIMIMLVIITILAIMLLIMLKFVIMFVLVLVLMFMILITIVTMFRLILVITFMLVFYAYMYLINAGQVLRPTLLTFPFQSRQTPLLSPRC